MGTTVDSRQGSRGRPGALGGPDRVWEEKVLRTESGAVRERRAEGSAGDVSRRASAWISAAGRPSGHRMRKECGAGGGAEPPGESAAHLDELQGRGQTKGAGADHHERVEPDSLHHELQHASSPSLHGRYYGTALPGVVMGCTPERCFSLYRLGGRDVEHIRSRLQPPVGTGPQLG